MGKYVFKLPDIGEGIAEAEIAQWHVTVGDVITEDQNVVDMLTEKAAVEIPSPVAGTVVERFGEAGDMVSVGGALIALEIDGKGNATVEEPSPVDVSPPAKSGAGETAQPDTDEAAQSGPPAPAPSDVPEPPSARAQEPAPDRAGPAGSGSAPTGAGRAASAGPPRAAGEKPLASPAVRGRARDRGVDLRQVAGSGPAGRITHEDLDAFLAPGALRPAAQAPARGPREGVEQIKVIGLRRKIAEAMQRAKQRIPHFAYVEEVDVTELEALRVHLNAERADGQPKLTLLPFLVAALDKAVPAFPQVNSTYDDEAGIVTRYDALHVGIATQTPNGLVVPVVRHAETLDLWGAAGEIRRLADAARSGKASLKELSGSSITITSLGPMGGIVSTPVINAPEVAIIGVNKMVERPMVVDGQITVRKIMNLSSSFDHRIVDGWDAAAFIQRIKALLEHPATLFLP